MIYLKTNNNTNDREEMDVGIRQLHSIDQNFGLTSIEFDEVVSLLKSGKEDLFERIFLAHFDYCMSYLKSKYKAIHDVAYDITMDTLIEFRHKLICDKISYGNLRYLFTKMACNTYIKTVSKENKLKEILLNSVEDEKIIEEQLISLKKAWSEIALEDKMILEKFYYFDIPLNKIAELENKTDATLRKQKQRAIEKLRAVFFTNYNG